MGTKKYSALPAASAISGTDLVSVNQGMSTVKATAANILTFFAVVKTSVLTQALNLKANLSTTGASLTFTADQLSLGTSLTGSTVLISSFNQTNNLSLTGAGGKDTGTMTAPGYVAVYAIYNPSTLTTSTLATTATAAAVPEIYAGANMPAGYTYSRLLSVWGLSANDTYQLGYQIGREIWIPEVVFPFDSQTGGAWIIILLQSAVPKNAKQYSSRVIEICPQAAAPTPILYLSGVQAFIGSKAITSAVSVNLSITEHTVRLPIFTPQSTYGNVPGIVNFVPGGGVVVCSYTI